MGTKIQINSLAALERLIGNDTEMEIELRNSIVQEFTKKHLRSIAEEKLPMYIKSLIEMVVREANEALGIKPTGVDSHISTAVHDKIKKAVMDRIDNAICVAADKSINEVADNIASEMKERMTDHAFEYAVNARVRQLLVSMSKQ